MGTSVSQASLKTAAWRSVAACYQSPHITAERTTCEVWRAATSQGTIEPQIKSDAVFACYQLAQQQMPPEKVHSELSAISARHGNSIVVEFAKRATIVATQSPKHAEHWPRVFFREITGYLVARDISGHVGPHSRNAGVTDLIKFKTAVARAVDKTIGGLRVKASSPEDWSKVATQALHVLSGKK